jgi:G3E family GTPase
MFDPPSREILQFTPVNLITGFLGSGKTTLLRRLLASPALADTAVLINEFGEVGLDHELLERIDEDAVLLSSGCLCCTVRGELADAIKSLHARRERGVIPAYKRLIIESTGLADPLPILTTIAAEPQLRHHYRLGRVVTTVDAVNGDAQLDRQPESQKQAAVADRLVVTKTDLADKGRTQRLVARLKRLNPAAPISYAVDALAPEALIGSNPFDLASQAKEVAHWFQAEAVETPGEPDPNRHDDALRAFALVFDQAIDWTAFGLWLSMLLHRHGEAILRVKGILAIEDESAPVAVHAVQQLVHAPTHLPRWPGSDRRTRIVFIVKGLEEAAIRRSFSVFVLKRPEADARQ